MGAPLQTTVDATVDGGPEVDVDDVDASEVAVTVQQIAVTANQDGGISVSVSSPPIVEVSAETDAPEVTVTATSEIQVVVAVPGTPGGGGGGGGTTWSNGPGVPSDLVGNDGDYYVRDTLLHIYRKASGTWGTPIGQWFPYN